MFRLVIFGVYILAGLTTVMLRKMTFASCSGRESSKDYVAHTQCGRSDLKPTNGGIKEGVSLTDSFMSSIYI